MSRPGLLTPELSGRRTPRSLIQHGGFTLLELLVAFAIMGMALAMIYRVMGSSARTAGDMATRQMAVQLADAVLQTRDSVLPSGWNEQGVHDRFRWDVRSEPYQSELAGRVRLHVIHLTVAWQEGAVTRQIQAATLLPQRSPMPGEPAS